MAWKLRAAWALAIVTAAPAVVVAAGEGPSFLDDGYFDVIDILPPAPIKEEPRGVADREIFKLTRSLKGSQRWQLAINDVAGDTASLMRDFSCAAALNLTPQNAPKTAALLEKATRDTERETNAVKNFYRRQRPFQIDQGETCQPQAEITGYDYPSGHATRGWTWGLVLAEALHERAAPILSRARAYGESRIVCGAHNASAVEAARLSATATMDIVRTEQAYDDAVRAARNELLALRKTSTPPSPSACSAEEALVGQPILR
ncbi:MAG: Acid phosphatase [Rhizorhabdus sp.]|nr:Acid phosphatase [Rhizorhabdus sp.]